MQKFLLHQWSLQHGFINVLQITLYQKYLQPVIKQ